ncbi:MAG: hypothetical protein GXP54_03900, partial [Deltaproteobacteria bacterium]|nr:hypothetical protein [Deltaproteobacteria bacterium]
MADEKKVDEKKVDEKKVKVSGDKPAKKPALAEAHPETESEYLKLNSVCVKAREARRNSGAIPGALADEAARLLAWADGVIDDTI